MRGLWRKIVRKETTQPKMDPRDAATIKVERDAWERFLRSHTIPTVFTEIGENRTTTVTESHE